jgi:hypothetical protein
MERHGARTRKGKGLARGLGKGKAAGTIVSIKNVTFASLKGKGPARGLG